jgi:hypothetical protein
VDLSGVIDDVDADDAVTTRGPDFDACPVPDVIAPVMASVTVKSEGSTPTSFTWAALTSCAAAKLIKAASTVEAIAGIVIFIDVVPSPTHTLLLDVQRNRCVPAVILKEYVVKMSIWLVGTLLPEKQSPTQTDSPYTIG